MDEPALQASLPSERVVEVGGARIGMVHIAGPAADARRGRGRSSRRATRSSTATRTSRRERAGGVWILNPGSPTERRRGPGHAMLLLRVDGGRSGRMLAV